MDEAINHIMSHHTDGDTLSTLWCKTVLFVERPELASALNACVKSKKLFKQGSMYYRSMQKPILVPATVCDKVQAKPKALKFGLLSANTQIGAVAFALFVYNEPLTIDEVVELVSVDRIHVSIALKKLCTQKYCYKRTTEEGYSVKWYSKFDYPFKIAKSSDLLLIKKLPTHFTWSYNA